MRTGWPAWRDGVIDTTTFVYASDSHDPSKHQKARSLLWRLEAQGQLAVSTQVLHELFVQLTSRKRSRPLTVPEAARRVRALAASATVYEVNEDITLLALDAVERHGFHLWDAVLWATAIYHGDLTIYTEDTPGHPTLGGVNYINPLAL